ncbi:hypothetical protein DUI87_23736 [Hirundo rustica rustica]|uniref:ribonuclease H n=1 Tax=Hirundo rustica rustica TaxID=333673 RepID=A0A3M0JFY0_HIRRU|nr:hypothetical protein DUI87_23736 [Hirundo rustica rustica]
MEVFEKGEIIQILLKGGFATKQCKVKGPARAIQFLGVKWQDRRQQIPTEVINKITAMSPPTSKKETQAFLGAIRFWRMHIPENSQIVSPLYLVTRKKNDFHWSPEQQQTFAQIKQEIAHAVDLSPVRRGPDVKNVLYSAAGNNGLSWSLWWCRTVLLDFCKKFMLWLQLTEGLHLKDDNWIFVSVDNSEQGTWPRVKDKLIVVGDCKHTPKEIEILPGTFDNNPGKFVLWLRCTHPTFLPKAKIVAQIIPTWEHLEEDNIPTVCPVHNITEVKPQVGCELQVGDKAINITGLLDTSAHVTVIPAKHWLSRWALENVAGHVQGIGGMQLAKQSKSVVQIKGPKGQLASLRPFVLDYREPMLGRDLMAQWGVTIDIPDPPQDFWAAVAEEHPTHKLNWKTDAPVWVEQWPLSKQKLKALEELVEEQLAKGHIVETTSPWNSPVFVIQKLGKDKWRLLQDLRQINNVIEDMGSLQPGMPTPTMLPQNWKLAVIDIKDCFFHIPLHPDDASRFAFSVPTVNREAPRKRYHWRVLPQGMKVSPIICQWYVASLLSPVRVAAEKAIIHHYMDDVLVCAPTDDVLSHALDLTINALVVAGFELQEDKVQRMPPWRYLGLEIGKRTIVPQKLEIKAKIKTLADVHQLCGALNWVRPWLGLTTEDLAPLFNLLKGGEELSSPRELTPEAKEALEKSHCTCLRMVGAPAQSQRLGNSRQGNGAGPHLPLRTKAEDVHKAIQNIRDMVNDIKRETGDWLNGLFGDWRISGWVGSILKSVLLFLFVILLILIGFGIIKKMLSRLISSTTHAPSVNHVAVSSVPGWEEDVELEEDPEDRRHPEDEPQMEWPTQPEWLTELPGLRISSSSVPALLLSLKQKRGRRGGAELFY